MTFTSWVFVAFLLSILSLHSISPQKYKKYILLAFSYGFYAWWDWRYTPLLLTSTLIDYFLAFAIFRQSEMRKRKALLLVSVLCNIGMLMLFKYYNFFISNINYITPLELQLHDLILPIGISFYTFQTLSYSIDVYRGEIKPEKNLVNFSLFVSFFPQLVAGPIERAKSLLPQISEPQPVTINMFRKALILILWGFFVKLVIADNLTVPIQFIFDPQNNIHSGIYIFGAAIFLVKLYADFMGYSEIARGTALLFGVKLRVNFRRPFFARSLREFWQRWHISLTSWIGDYVNKPLKNKLSSSHWKKYIVILVMVLVGFWHGASWNFVMYGAVQGIILFLWIPIASFFNQAFAIPDKVRSIVGWFFMYLSILIVSPMFLITEFSILSQIMDNFIKWEGGSFINAMLSIGGKANLAFAFVGIMMLTIVSFLDEFSSHSCYDRLLLVSSYTRWFVCSIVLILMLILGKYGQEPFIYFAF